MADLGQEMHRLCRELFPICRSITGEGFRKSLAILKSYVPALCVIEVPTGTKCFDWEVPKEWNIRDAYIETPCGERICDFKVSNLHVVGYSMPVDEVIDYEDLQRHLYSLPAQPSAIPYVTSYYKGRWGFCIAHEDRERLTPGKYRVFIVGYLCQGLPRKKSLYRATFVILLWQTTSFLDRLWQHFLQSGSQG